MYFWWRYLFCYDVLLLQVDSLSCTIPNALVLLLGASGFKFAPFARHFKAICYIISWQAYENSSPFGGNPRTSS